MPPKHLEHLKKTVRQAALSLLQHEERRLTAKHSKASAELDKLNWQIANGLFSRHDERQRDRKQQEVERTKASIEKAERQILGLVANKPLVRRKPRGV